MKLQFEILPKEQLELYPHLKIFKQMGFTLFGGTAIALQLGHRKSIDFDFFTDKDISNFKDKLLNINHIKVSEILQEDKNTLVYETSSGVKLSFFGTLDFVKLSGKIEPEDNVLSIADLSSLLTTKLKAVCDRAEYKDYVDIACILKTRQVSLEQSLNKVNEFFGKDYPLVYILKGLTYFEDGDLYKLSKEDKKILCEEASKIELSLSNQNSKNSQIDKPLSEADKKAKQKEAAMRAKQKQELKSKTQEIKKDKEFDR